MKSPGPIRSSARMVVQSLTRPYPLRLSTAAFVGVFLLLVMSYIFIGELMPGRNLHAPALGWDRLVPLQPAWALVYGSLYLFLILLPVLVVRQEALIRRTVFAYLFVWIVAYVFFFLYPTIAPRPAKVIGEGFIVWGLRFLYSADPPYNCFPSLHVAHSFVSALSCHRVNRRLGIAAMGCAALVGVSTLYTKQHYVVDVVAGIALAGVANVLFLRGYPREAVPESDRRVAPLLALVVIGILALVGGGFWVAYLGGWGQS